MSGEPHAIGDNRQQVQSQLLTPEQRAAPLALADWQLAQFYEVITESIIKPQLDLTGSDCGAAQLPLSWFLGDRSRDRRVVISHQIRRSSNPLETLLAALRTGSWCAFTFVCRW